jgi:hypothetical protein
MKGIVTPPVTNRVKFKENPGMLERDIFRLQSQLAQIEASRNWTLNAGRELTEWDDWSSTRMAKEKEDLKERLGKY